MKNYPEFPVSPTSITLATRFKFWLPKTKFGLPGHHFSRQNGVLCCKEKKYRITSYDVFQYKFENFSFDQRTETDSENYHSA